MSIIDQSWYTRPEGLPEVEAAGGVVARVEGKKILVAAVSEEGSDSLILPKGHVEEGESIEEAAVREIEEEAGVSDLQLLTKLGVCERCNFAMTEWKQIHYFLFLTREAETNPTEEDIDYVTHWYDLEDLPELFWPEQAELLRTNKETIIRHVKQAAP